MGRKSLSDARTEEILSAFARCMVRYGLDTSLDQVAEAAGMTRSIIRHYIGNREEVVTTLMQRIADSMLTTLHAMGEGIPPDRMIPLTLDYLFQSTPEDDPDERLIVTVMMTARDRYPVAKRIVIGLMEALIGLFADDLQRAYPSADAGACHRVAYSVICLAMTNESLLTLGMDADLNRAARQSAEALIALLTARAS